MSDADHDGRNEPCVLNDEPSDHRMEADFVDPRQVRKLDGKRVQKGLNEEHEGSGENVQIHIRHVRNGGKILFDHEFERNDGEQ